MIKIIEHFETGETRVFAFDHLPFSVNRTGVPPSIFDAALQGLGENIPEFDCRVFEWQDEQTDIWQRFPKLKGCHAKYSR